MYSTEQEKSPYSIDSVDCLLRVPETSSVKSEGTIYSPENLSVEEANKHLMFGFYEEIEGCQYLDYRLLPGEFVILQNVETNQMYRVESFSYNWRSTIRNNNPNLLHRFFELLDYSYLRREEDEKYAQMFPVLTFYDQESLSKTLPIVIWPQNTEIQHFVPTNRDAKLYNIWQAFLVAVPLCRQAEVIDFYEILAGRRTELISWLIETSETKPVYTDYSRRAQDILIKTRSFAEKRQQNDGRNLREMINDNIRNFISKEKGNSLYKLIREMDNFKKQEEKENE